MKSYLHSTMLLLYLSPVVLWPDFSNYLHSTMLLLYHSRGSPVISVFFIYIPLCFYFIESEGSGEPEDDGFTFHYASTLSQPSLSGPSPCTSFTFHYASTLSAGRPRAFIAVITFTFHYASTLSKSFEPDYKQYINLHSTMLLLYPVGQHKSWSKKSYLHSTMLLLYPVRGVIR